MSEDDESAPKNKVDSTTEVASNEEPKDQTPSGRPSVGRLVLATLALLLVLDLISRAYLSHRQTSLDEEFAKQYPPETYVTSFAARQDYRFINLYTMNPKSITSNEYHFDDMGFRLDKHNLRLGANDGFKHVWMLGGSTTQGLGLREGETIAAKLNDLLADAKSEWRVLNLGQGGFTTTQELLLLTELLEAGHRPDAIVCYDGINDIPFDGDITKTGSPGWERHSVKSSVVRDMQGAESSSALTALTLTRWTKLDDMMGKIFGRLHGSARIPPANLADRGGTSQPGTNWDVVMRRYLVNLNLIRSAGEMLGVPVVLYFQPVMEYEDHYKLRAYSDYETTKLIPQMANNEFQRREALYAGDLDAQRKALKGSFQDIHDVFRGHDGETLYADPRHPNGAGAAIIALRILKDLQTLGHEKNAAP